MDTAAETTIDPHGADDGEVVNPALVAASQEPVKPSFVITDDQNQVTYGDKKYVREEALHAERQQLKEAKQALDNLRPLMPDFERFLQSQQNGQRATQQRATAGVESDYSQDELAGYAITRGYYDAENKPDLRRAQQDLDIMTAIADRRAGRAVKPVAEMTQRDRALDNMRAIAGQTFADGEPVADQKYLQAVFEAAPEASRANPQEAQILAVLAAGLQALDERKTGGRRSTRREPTFREGSGGSFGRAASQLDALGRAAARARGKTDEQWSKMSNAAGGTGFGGDILEEV